MALAPHFNLSSKTQQELKGLYIDVFNKLGDTGVHEEQYKHMQSMMHFIELAIAAR